MTTAVESLVKRRTELESELAALVDQVTHLKAEIASFEVKGVIADAEGRRGDVAEAEKRGESARRRLESVSERRSAVEERLRVLRDHEGVVRRSESERLWKTSVKARVAELQQRSEADAEAVRRATAEWLRTIETFRATVAEANALFGTADAMSREFDGRDVSFPFSSWTDVQIGASMDSRLLSLLRTLCGSNGRGGSIDRAIALAREGREV